MSVVSGVVLTFSVCEQESEDEFSVLLAHVNDWLMERHNGRLLLVEDHFGGSKHPQIFVAGAGINFLDEDEFAAYVTALPWQLPECVVLIINPEEGATRVFRATEPFEPPESASEVQS